MNRIGLAIAVLAVTTVPAQRAGAGILVDFSGTDGTIGHGAVRVSDDTFAGSSSYETLYNSRPVLAPFMDPTGAGGRFAEHPVTALDFIYARLTGAGAFQFDPDGTSFGTLPFGTGTFSDPGTNLPTAAHTGTLPSDLVLPNGTTIAAGSTIYSDFASLEVDVSAAADYWFDAGTSTEFRTFRGGTWAFFYDQGGSFTKFAEYQDVTVSLAIDWAALTVSGTWTATPVAVAGVLLPASGTTTSADPVSVDGILTNETGDPYTGFYGRFPGSFTLDFDTASATVVPEPSGFALLGLGAVTFAGYGWRRRWKRRKA